MIASLALIQAEPGAVAANRLRQAGEI